MIMPILYPCCLKWFQFYTHGQIAHIIMSLSLHHQPRAIGRELGPKTHNRAAQKKANIERYKLKKKEEIKAKKNKY